MHHERRMIELPEHYKTIWKADVADHIARATSNISEQLFSTYPKVLSERHASAFITSRGIVLQRTNNALSVKVTFP